MFSIGKVRPILLRVLIESVMLIVKIFLDEPNMHLPVIGVGVCVIFPSIYFVMLQLKRYFIFECDLTSSYATTN